MIPDSSVNTSPSRRGWWVLGAIIFVAAAVLLVMFQQGGLLSARVFNGETRETSTETDTEPVGEGDIYAQKENYCQAQKEAFIVDCGDVIPENDYNCRTKEADDFYAQCLLTITDEEVQAKQYELPALDDEPSLDL